jgi:FkbM family methyltransferase
MIPEWLRQSPVSALNVCRAVARSSYMGEATALCRVLAHYLCYVDTTDLGVAPHLIMGGCWESWITVAIARAIEPGAYCLDLGANHGYYMLLMALGAGPGGRVIAVEPIPRLGDLIERTLTVNGLNSYVRLDRAACSSEANSSVDLVLPDGRFLNACLAQRFGGPDVAPSASSPAVRVRTTTVDDLVAGWPRVDLIKMDVEGSEQATWRGMSRTLAGNSRLRIIMEFNIYRYFDPARFLAEIRACGFRLAYIDFEANIIPSDETQLLDPNHTEDWMLFLAR